MFKFNLFLAVVVFLFSMIGCNDTYLVSSGSTDTLVIISNDSIADTLDTVIVLDTNILFDTTTIYDSLNDSVITIIDTIVEIDSFINKIGIDSLGAGDTVIISEDFMFITDKFYDSADFRVIMEAIDEGLTSYPVDSIYPTTNKDSIELYRATIADSLLNFSKATKSFKIDFGYQNDYKGPYGYLCSHTSYMMRGVVVPPIREDNIWEKIVNGTYEFKFIQWRN